MSLRLSTFAVVSIGFFSLAAVVLAEKPKKDDPAAADKEVVKSKATRKTAAATVNFRKELNLPFGTLNTLGGRIDAARRAHDPVALAHHASELAIAEKVAGQKASLTSSAVLKESAELAKLRSQQKELEAVRQVSDQIATQQDEILGIKNLIADAKARAEADKEAIARNEEPTWKPRKVVVNNYTPQYLDIYVNGNLKTQVVPGGAQVIVIEHRWNPTVLTAYGNDDAVTWGPRYIWGRFDKYTWNIE